MLNRTQIYTVHEQPEEKELSARTVFVREGFSVWAFVFQVLWLIYHRLWLAAAGYVAVSVGLALAAQNLGFSSAMELLIQLALQLMLGFSAYDLMRWTLGLRGYRPTGIVVAESELAAERRYHDQFA